MSLGLAIFASVVLVLAVYHKQFRKFLFYAIAVGVVLGAIGLGAVYLRNRYEAAKYEKHLQAVKGCVARNQNVGDILDQLAALNGMSLEEKCESDPALTITPTQTTTSGAAMKAQTPGRYNSRRGNIEGHELGASRFHTLDLLGAQPEIRRDLRHLRRQRS